MRKESVVTDEIDVDSWDRPIEPLRAQRKGLLAHPRTGYVVVATATAVLAVTIQVLVHERIGEHRQRTETVLSAYRSAVETLETVRNARMRFVIEGSASPARCELDCSEGGHHER